MTVRAHELEIERRKYASHVERIEQACALVDSNEPKSWSRRRQNSRHLSQREQSTKARIQKENELIVRRLREIYTRPSSIIKAVSRSDSDRRRYLRNTRRSRLKKLRQRELRVASGNRALQKRLESEPSPLSDELHEWKQRLRKNNKLVKHKTFDLSLVAGASKKASFAISAPQSARTCTFQQPRSDLHLSGSATCRESILTPRSRPQSLHQLLSRESVLPRTPMNEAWLREQKQERWRLRHADEGKGTTARTISETSLMDKLVIPTELPVRVGEVSVPQLDLRDVKRKHVTAPARKKTASSTEHRTHPVSPYARSLRRSAGPRSKLRSSSPNLPTRGDSASDTANLSSDGSKCSSNRTHNTLGELITSRSGSAGRNDAGPSLSDVDLSVYEKELQLLEKQIKHLRARKRLPQRQQ